MDRTPGARAALTTVEFGMAVAGGPARFFAGLGLSAAHEKVVQKTTERFEAVGYSSQVATAGGEGLPSIDADHRRKPCRAEPACPTHQA